MSNSNDADVDFDLSRGIEKVPVRIQGKIKTEVSDFVYARINIPGPGAAESRDSGRPSSASRGRDAAGAAGCVCDGACSPAACPCLRRFGPSYDAAGKLVGVDPFGKVMKPVYECNKSCACSADCTNRVVQRGLQVLVHVFRTADDKGLGVRTDVPIPQDSFVCEYAGEVLSYDAALTRTRSLKDTDPHYIMVFKEQLSSGKVIATYVDPMFIGNVGRFINHSCEPNLFMVPVRVDSAVPHLALFAVRDIEAGEELSFDYSGIILDRSGTGGYNAEAVAASVDGAINQNQNEYAREDGEDADEFGRESMQTPVIPINIQPDPLEGKVEFGKKTCRCGSDMCRGYIPFESSLYPEEDRC